MQQQDIYVTVIGLHLEKKVKLETELALQKVYKYYLIRADNFWAGLLTDLVTEQTKMRSLKCLGGLTRGLGMGKNKKSVGYDFAELCWSWREDA